MKLSQRYPDIQLLLTITGPKRCRLPTGAGRLERWFANQSAEQIEILYIGGLIGHPLPDAIAQWLCAQPQRALIFVEPRLGAFAAFDQPQLVANPQIHFVFGGGEVVEELAARYPSERIAVYESKGLDGFALKRRSAAYSALYSDILYSHKIVANVLHNMRRLVGTFIPSGDFGQLPLLVCGAGPSLEQAIEALDRYPDRALILAVGSGIAALSKGGGQPHLAMALDPNDDEFFHLCQGRFFEGPFLFSPRLQRDVWATSNGPFGLLQSDTGGLIEAYLAAEMQLAKGVKGPDLGSEAFSVTTLALSWALSMGFTDIALAGVDLAFTGGRRYGTRLKVRGKQEAEAGTLDQVVEARDMYGRRCQTQIKWIMEADVIAQFAASHPQIRLINCSMGGRGIEGICNCCPEEWLASFPQRDMRGWTHQFSQRESTAFDLPRFERLVHSLFLSLERCRALCLKIPIESSGGKAALLMCDLRDEPAYRALLEGIDRSLEHLLERYHPHLNPDIVAQEREEARYKEMVRQIDLFLPIFSALAKKHPISLL